MANTIKKLATAIMLILFSTILSLHLSQAQTSDLSTAKDSDYDGLTDQGEKEIFKTDFQNPDSDGDGFLDGAEVLTNTNPLTPQATSSPITNTTIETPWPWYISRTSAIVAYLLLFLLIVSGIMIKTSIMFRFVSPTTAWINHRLIGYSMSLAVITHIASLLFDTYSKFTIANLLVPFNSNFKPPYLTLGIIAFYLLIIVILTSIFHIDKYPKTWRVLHYLTYPIFFLVSVHGFFTGTDTNTVLMQITYISTGTIVGALILYRIYFAIRQA